MSKEDPPTVLVVEDHELVRETIRRLLSMADYSVIDCATPEEALREVERPGSHVDVLLTDIVMPGMSVSDLVEKAQDIDPALRVVYMSGYPLGGGTESPPLARDALFLQKPFTGTSLLDVVRAALS